MEIRSFRSVFDLERRVYSVDRLRLNPGGVPVRGVAYFLAILVGVQLAAALPAVGVFAHALPWYLRDLALPGLGATVLGAVRLEGRTFHHAALALLRHRLGPRRLAGVHAPATVGTAWYPQDIVLLPDGSDARMRRLRYSGPGAVLVALEHERAGRAVERGSRGLATRGLRAELHIRERAGARALPAGEVISLASGVKLLVRPRASGG
jgi:hypothetical protein